MSERTKQLFDHARELYEICNFNNDHEIAIRLGSSNWCMTYEISFEPTYIDGNTTLGVANE